MKLKLALACVALVIVPSSLAAQASTDVFTRLWTDHINICGPLLDEPLAVLDERVAPPGFQDVLWFGTEDRTDVTVNYLSANSQWLAVIEVWTTATQTSFHCSIAYADFEGSWLFESAPEVLASILGLIDQTAELAASGGLIDGLTDEDGSDDYLYSSSILVTGAFPNHSDAISRVTTHELGMSVQVDAFLDLPP